MRQWSAAPKHRSTESREQAWINVDIRLHCAAVRTAACVLSRSRAFSSEADTGSRETLLSSSLGSGTPRGVLAQ